PDSLDRYYQEVGRGGRDGYQADAVLLYADWDREAAVRLAISRLEVRKALARIRAMWTRHRLPDGSVLLDPAKVPDYSVKKGQPGWQPDGLHQTWNMVTLNALERAGVLHVEGPIA